MFKSFFHAGFECTIGRNRDGDWIDLVEDTWHQHHVDDDYRRLRTVGIAVARDAIRWPLVDLGSNRFDFSTVRPVVEAAVRRDVQVIWDLFHYGYPEDLDLLSETFVNRFADYCAACARYLRRYLPGTLWFTPVNEPSYLSWAAGEIADFPPYLNDRSHDVKVALVRAAIRGVDAILAEVPDARFVHADPLCRVAPCDDRPHSVAAAGTFNEDWVYEAWDMLCGKRLPELGGSPRHLDVIGINYYWNCQWVHGEQGTWLDPDDPRRTPLAELVRDVWSRYGADLVISETSHWGENRAPWMAELTGEVDKVLRAGVPLRGVCLYPIIGMLDWHSPRRWMPMGLWDIDVKDGMRRVLHQPMLQALRRAQRHVRRRIAGR